MSLPYRMPEDDLREWMKEGTRYDFELLVRFIVIELAHRGYHKAWIVQLLMDQVALALEPFKVSDR